MVNRKKLVRLIKAILSEGEDGCQVEKIQDIVNADGWGNTRSGGERHTEITFSGYDEINYLIICGCSKGLISVSDDGKCLATTKGFEYVQSPRKVYANVAQEDLVDENIKPRTPTGYDSVEVVWTTLEEETKLAVYRAAFGEVCDYNISENNCSVSESQCSMVENSEISELAIETPDAGMEARSDICLKDSALSAVDRDQHRAVSSVTDTRQSTSSSRESHLSGKRLADDTKADAATHVKKAKRQPFYESDTKMTYKTAVGDNTNRLEGSMVSPGTSYPTSPIGVGDVQRARSELHIEILRYGQALFKSMSAQLNITAVENNKSMDSDLEDDHDQ